MSNWLKRLIKWSTWKEIKYVSHLHVIINSLALKVKEKNFEIWKTWLSKTLKFYYSLNGKKERGNGDKPNEGE